MERYIKSLDDIWECSDEELASITFNDEPSCRLGYQYLCPALMYSSIGMNLAGNPYDIPEYQGRGYAILTEMAFTLGLDYDVEDAVELMREQVGRIGRMRRKLTGELAVLRDFHRSVKGEIDYVGIVEAVIRKHLLIGDKLFNGGDTGLNDLLEMIAATITNHLATVLKIPVFPAPRESFILPLSDRTKVGSFMLSFYKEHFETDINVVQFAMVRSDDGKTS